MAIPYVVSGGLPAGVGVAGGDLNVTISSTFPILADDIIIASCTAQDNVALAFPAGWTIFFEENNGATQRTTLAWKRAAGGEEGSVFTITHTGGSYFSCTVVAYRGCLTSATPIDVVDGQSNASSTTCTGPSVDTVTDGVLVLFVASSVNTGTGTNTNADAVSANLGDMWEHVDGSSNRCHQAVDDAFQSVHGATGEITSTLNTARVNQGVVFALIGDPSAPEISMLNSAAQGTGYSTIGRVQVGPSTSADRLTMVVVTTASRDGIPEDPLSVTDSVNGALTKYGSSYDFDTNKRVSIWYLINPASTAVSTTATVVFPKPMVFGLMAEKFSGVHQTVPFSPTTFAVARGNSTTAEATIADTQVGNTVLGIFGAAAAPPGTTGPTITKDAAQTTLWSTSTQQYAFSSGGVHVGGGPHRVGEGLTSEPAGGGDVTSSWTLSVAKEWQVILLELMNTAAVVPEEDPDPGETETNCQLVVTQHRADHLSGFIGVRIASRMVDMGPVLGYTYAGHSETLPNLSTLGGSWHDIFFRTYDPDTQLFSTPVIVESVADSFLEYPARAGMFGSAIDKPNLIRLNDGRLICSWGQILIFDFPTFTPTDPTYYGGGIYVKESTDNGATWGTKYEIAPLIWDVGNLVTDGTHVWQWAFKHSTSADTKPFVTYGNYDAPTFDVNMYVRNSEGSWTEKVVYEAELTTRTYHPETFSYTGDKDSLNALTTPKTNAVLINENIGLIIGYRTGTSLDSSPLTGPGTIEDELTGRLVCWRTTDGGNTWIEQTLVTNNLVGGMEGTNARIVVTNAGRIYVSYKLHATKVYVRHVTSSGAGNKTLTSDQGTDVLHWPFEEGMEGLAIDENDLLGDGNTIATVDDNGNPITVVTVANNLSGAMVDDVVRASLPGSFYVFMAVMYSDDNGATWEDAGIVSQRVMSYNTDLESSIDYDTGGTTSMALNADGRVVIMGLNHQLLPAISVWKSNLIVDKEPTVFDYYGCFGIPVDRTFGGWQQSDALIWSDGNIYELEQFQFDDEGSPNWGREELWIISYPGPGGGGGEPEPEPGSSVSPPFVRAPLLLERPRHPAGNPTIRRVGS